MTLINYQRIGTISRARRSSAFSRVVANTITRATVAAMFSAVGIVFVKRVAAYAVGFSGVATPKGINQRGDRLKVRGIQATTNPAKMINDHTVGESPNEYFVRDPVNLSSLVTAQIESPVALIVEVPSKQPARTSLKGDIRIETYFAENSGEQFSVSGKFVRVIGEHLRLLCSFDGLGFRGLTHREALSF